LEIGTHSVSPSLAVKAKSLDQLSPIRWIEFPERLYEIEDVKVSFCNLLIVSSIFHSSRRVLRPKSPNS